MKKRPFFTVQPLRPKKWIMRDLTPNRWRVQDLYSQWRVTEVRDESEEEEERVNEESLEPVQEPSEEETSIISLLDTIDLTEDTEDSAVSVPPTVDPSDLNVTTFNSECLSYPEEKQFKIFLSSMEGILHSIQGTCIDKETLHRIVSPTAWLNDEAINGYLTLLSWYADQRFQKKVLALSTFFLPTLVSKQSYILKHYDYSNVQRWTKNYPKGIFSFDLILIPVNHGNTHW
jgi:hypothetical protein